LNPGIQSRLLVTTTLVLGISLTVAGVVLDRTFRVSTLSGAQEQLRLVIYSLMGAVETQGRRVAVSDPRPEPRLDQPESGLYAWITTPDGRIRWRSNSAVTGGVTPQLAGDLQPGEFAFSGGPVGAASLLHLSYAVIWEDAEEAVLTFHVATAWRPFQAAIQSFRRNLYVGVGVVTALFMLAQVLAVRWALRPLRTMAHEVRELEEGRRERLSRAYPSELTGLANNLDRFVAHEERSRSRYRKAMEDLAHSLKTPLAVVRNALEQVPAEPRALLEEQLDRMQSTVNHQLSRAAISGPVIVGRPLDAALLVERLVRALQTAYRDRHIEVSVELPQQSLVRGDERDIMEILGNLLENAFKYTRSRIRVSGETVRTGGRTGGVVIRIDDDGKGIAPHVREAVLNRGTRADEVQPGQGIGLSVVAELVALYGGRLGIGDSDLGGARLELELP
jgi:two-component system, OmpR family, sensor histidine kinase PhoQ